MHFDIRAKRVKSSVRPFPRKPSNDNTVKPALSLHHQRLVQCPLNYTCPLIWGTILDIITNFYNICSTSNLSAKLYIEYSHCYIFLPNSIYICYVLQKSFLCFHTVWSTLRTVWYDAPRASFSKIDPRPLLAIFCSRLREQT